MRKRETAANDRRKQMFSVKEIRSRFAMAKK